MNATINQAIETADNPLLGELWEIRELLAQDDFWRAGAACSRLLGLKQNTAIRAALTTINAECQEKIAAGATPPAKVTCNNWGYNPDEPASLRWPFDFDVPNLQWPASGNGQIHGSFADPSVVTEVQMSNGPDSPLVTIRQEWIKTADNDGRPVWRENLSARHETITP